MSLTPELQGLPLAAAPALTPRPSLPLALPFPLTVAAFCLLWSSAFSVAKLGLADCPPLLLLTIRFLLAGAIVLGGTALAGRPVRLGRRDLLLFAVLGIANQAVYLGLSYVGMGSVSSGLTALVISANPVLAAVLAAVFLNERLTWRKALGLALGITGVAIVVQGRLAGGIDAAGGLVFTFAALVSLVAGTILFKRLAPRGDLWVGNGVQSLAAGLALMPVALASENIGDIVPSWRLAFALAFLVLLVSVIAYLLWFQMLTVAGATAASAWHFVMPPLGLMFGWLVLGEPVAAVDLVGIVPVAVGIWLVTRAPAGRQQSSRRCPVGDAAE
jgi:drug/metabolite transporter (DMT)-like permease